MEFRLHSDYKPTGDQPHAITALVRGLKQNQRHQTLLGVTGSGKTFTMANIIANVQRPTLIISHNKTLASQLYQEFRAFFPENAVHYFVSYYDYYLPEAYIPQTDTYIEKDAKINEIIDQLRHATTQDVLSRRDVIVVASVSCIYGMGDPAEYKSLSLNLKKGARMTQKECIRALVHLQYERSHNEFLPGNFRVRGDIIEIFPVSGLDAFRVELFGGSISALERVSCDVSGKTAIHGEELPELSLFPAKHFVMPREKLLLALRAIETELALHLKNLRSTQKIIEADRLERRTQYDLETLREFGYCSGIENYSRHLSFRNAGEAPYTLLNYFPRDFLVFIDESHMTIPQLSAMYLGDRARKEVLVQYGFRLPSALDNRPLQFSEFEKRVLNTIYVSATPGPYEIRKSMAAAEKGSGIVEQLLRPTGLLDPEIEIHPSAGQIEHLATKLRACIAKGQRALVLTLTKRLAEDVAEYLTSRGIKTAYLHSEIPTLMRPRIIQDLCAGTYDVLVGINLLREGIDLPEVALVAILDADKEGFLRNDVTLIQMMGRAARHLEGKVLLYADRITTSLKGAIKETERRRAHQRAYNAKHGITPKTIERRIRELPLWLQDKQSFRPQSIFKQRLPLSLPDSAEAQKRVLEREMRRAARDLEFEYAIYIRDLLKELEKSGKVQSS